MNLFWYLIPIGTTAIILAVFKSIHDTEKDPTYAAFKKQQASLRLFHLRQAQDARKQKWDAWWKSLGIKPKADRN